LLLRRGRPASDYFNPRNYRRERGHVSAKGNQQRGVLTPVEAQKDFWGGEANHARTGSWAVGDVGPLLPKQMS